MATGYTVSGLTNYVEEHQFELVRASVVQAKTISMVQIKPDIKTASKLPIQNTTVTLQAGGTCTFNALGGTAITQRTLTVAPIGYQDTYCPNDLNAKYTQYALQKGSKQDALPFESEITDSVVEQVAAINEKAVWQGDTNSADANLNKFDGFLKTITGCTGYVTGNTISATAMTAATVIANINAVYANIPLAVLDKSDTVIFVGWDVFRLYIIALTALNLYSYTADGAQNSGEIFLIGTATKIVAVHGLDGTNKIVAGRTSNFWVGMDMESEETKLDIWYSKDDKNIKLDLQYKLGVQVAICSELVYFTL